VRPRGRILIRASDLGIGASGVGLVQLRHREDLMVRGTTKRPAGRWETSSAEINASSDTSSRPPSSFPLIIMAGRLRTRSKPQLLPFMSSA
jgi:hypothetical protein